MRFKIRHFIVGIIDFFHKPFTRFIPTQTFRYLVCGGTNTLMGMVCFSVIYNFVLHGHDITILTALPITARVATLFMTFCVNVPFGFVLSSYIVFPESQINTKVQFVRYTGAAISFIVIAYLLTKFFAFAIPLVRADIANIFVSMITAVLSYLSQRFYTFKITPAGIMEDETVLED